MVRLTWDFDLPHWKLLGDESGRRMAIRHESLAKSCQVGDGQNIHGTWLAGAEKVAGKKLKVSSSRGCLTVGAEVVLHDDEFHPSWRSTIVNCTEVVW